MSGGYYEYLCFKGPEELMNSFNIKNMEKMCDMLLKLGYDDIARDMQRLIEYCHTAYNRIDVLKEQLNDVMYAIEWYDSGDYGIDNLKKHLEDYRNGKENKNDN